MRQYTDKETLENYTLTNIDDSFDDQIDAWIETVSAWIEQFTGRVFIADGEATARKFSGEGTNRLLIDDCIEITTVEQGSNAYGDSFTTIPASGELSYIPLPENYVARELPINELHLRGSVWCRGLQNHQVTAKWGYSEACPVDVKFAATVLVAGIINATRKDKEEIRSERIGSYTVTYADQKGSRDFDIAMENLRMRKRWHI